MIKKTLFYFDYLFHSLFHSSLDLGFLKPLDSSLELFSISHKRQFSFINIFLIPTIKIDLIEHKKPSYLLNFSVQFCYIKFGESFLKLHLVFYL